MKSERRPLKIDFVSDVSCPWCAIGLHALEQALDRVSPDVTAEVHLQPFELNPQMAPGGEDLIEHIARKYGSTPQQVQASRDGIRARGEALGFAFDMEKCDRLYNTFDAHRLLHWAGHDGKQLALKHALFSAYFTDGRDPSDHETLIDIATQVGLDAATARDILTSDRYAAEVRRQEQSFNRLGVTAVPSVIVNDTYLIQGGQPVEVFEQALRQIAVESR
jgi:predicted DsbA family dithiol-disulfide isomerase